MIGVQMHHYWNTTPNMSPNLGGGELAGYGWVRRGITYGVASRCCAAIWLAPRHHALGHDFCVYIWLFLQCDGYELLVLLGCYLIWLGWWDPCRHTSQSLPKFVSSLLFPPNALTCY